MLLEKWILMPNFVECVFIAQGIHAINPIKRIFMKSIQNQILSGGGYVSPVSKVVEIQPEGVLCGSTKQYGSGIDDLTETDFEW